MLLTESGSIVGDFLFGIGWITDVTVVGWLVVGLYSRKLGLRVVSSVLLSFGIRCTAVGTSAKGSLVLLVLYDTLLISPSSST